MNTSLLNIKPAAVISFEGNIEKLRACIQALSSWVSPIIIVHSKNDKYIKQTAEELKVSTCICPSSETSVNWNTGISQINKEWVLLIRSNEIITGQLRKTIVEKIKSHENIPCKFEFPLTLVFLKKRLKYSLDWYGSKLSCLAYLSKNHYQFNQLSKKHTSFDGELIRYSDDTLSECIETVTKKAEEIARHLAKHTKVFSFRSLFCRGIVFSIKKFYEVYFFKKGFKEGFEGAVFAVFEAHAELLGYLRYYELYVRGGKNLHDNLPSLKNILVIKLRDIGDNILCTPLIYNLKKQLPNASISVLTWSYSKPVFENNPSIKRLFALSKEPSSSEINCLCGELNPMGFDVVINTHSSALSTRLLSKIKSKNQINNYYRGRNKAYNLITNESNYYRSSIERDLDCLRSLGLEPTSKKTEIFLNDSEQAWAKEKLKSCGLSKEKKLVLIHPTAAVSIREWPLKNFNQLIQSLSQNKNIQTIVICTGTEFLKIKILLDDIPDLVVFHQMTVRQMMAIIRECDLVIDNDSSPSHVATAFGIPAIVLFSQAIREIFRPYHPEKDHHFIFYNDVDCRECELTNCDNRICLEFSPDEVYAQAMKMIFRETK